VSVFAPPRPALTPKPPALRCAPGLIIIKLDPSDCIDDCIEAVAPWPMDTSAITEEIPMTMPKIVSPERTLLADSAAYVSSKVSVSVMVVMMSVCGRALRVLRHAADGFFCLIQQGRP
jgi:hypothetical protein